MEQRTCNAYVRTSVDRPLVLIEDDSLDLDTLDLSPPGVSAFDVAVCTGPASDAEPCPLVMDAVCPFGRPAVVVSAFAEDNPWTRSVRRAWALEGVPVVTADADDGPLVWPAHVGAAIRSFIQS